VVTIDLPPSNDAHFVPGELIRQSTARDRVQQVYGDSKTFDFSPYRGAMDLVFVDAGHEYPDVCADSENALGMVKPDGVVVWDDYTSWTGVRRCVNELASDLPIVHVAGTRLAVLRR
jgi:predicted O-methyltransferase YrrM